MGKTNISGCGFAHGSNQIAGQVTEKRPFVPLVGARWEVRWSSNGLLQSLLPSALDNWRILWAPFAGALCVKFFDFQASRTHTGGWQKVMSRGQQIRTDHSA